MKNKIILFSNTSWYLYNFRLPLALALRANGYDVLFLAPEDNFTVRLIDQGFRFLNIDMKRDSLNPFRELYLIYKIRKILYSESPKIIFNFTIKCAVYGSIAARFSGVNKRVNAVAGLGAIFTGNSLKIKLLLPLVKFLMKLTLSGNQSSLILQNPDDVELFINNKLVKKEHIYLIKGSGVNSERFNIDKKISWRATGKRRVLFASRLLWSKGIQYFIDAAKNLKNDKKYEFLIAGTADDGNPASVEENQLKLWSSDGYITLLGHVDKMEELMSEVDLVVLPSSYGEGVPRILIEAAASSLPIVAFDNQGSREIVLNEVNGYLVEKNNLDELIYAISSIFSSEETYLAMSKASRNHFLEFFEESTVIKRTLEVVSNT